MLAHDPPANIKVSVIIPAYNTEKYIAHALQSALDQTERSIEVIVVDDGSSDDTVQVTKSFIDERIKLIVTANNAGPSHARNCALRLATGDWIAILDSDDWYAPERLAQLLAAAHSHNTDMVADDLYMIHDEAEHPWGTLFSQSGSNLTEVRNVDAVDFVESHLPGLDHLGLGSSKPLIRRRFLEQHGLMYDETVRCGEDFQLYLMCLVHGARFTIIPDAYYYYRSRKGSIIDGNNLHNQNHLRQLNLGLLRHKLIANNVALTSAISRQLFLIEEQISYYSVIQPLKTRSFLTAFSEMRNNPAFFSVFITRIPEMFRFRFHRILRKLKNLARKNQ
ncbi:MAG: glycosyltransferase [Gammaproteobacteria bacterium]